MITFIKNLLVGLFTFLRLLIQTSKRISIAILLLSAALLPVPALAQLSTQGGGTGTTSPSGILNGVTGNLHLQTLKIGSGLIFNGTTLSASAGSGASTTLLTDSNTFSGTINKFTNAPAVGVTGLLKGNGSSAITAGVNGTDFTLLTAKTCNAGDFVSAATAAGVFTCTTPAGTSYTGTYPIIITGSVISSGFGTTTTWGAGNNGVVMTGATGIPFVTATSSALNFSISGSAGSVANAVTFNNGGSGASSGQTYNGSGAVTISYNTIGAQPAGSYDTFAWPFTATTFGSGIIAAATSSVLYPSGGLVTGTSTIGKLVASSSITNQSVTSALVLNSSAGLEGAYTGTAPCSGAQAIVSLSATGVGTCITVSTFSYPFTAGSFGTGIVVAATSSALFPAGGLISGTSTIGALTASSSITNQSVKSALVLNSATGLEGAYAGSNPCTGTQAALSLSATGVISCTGSLDTFAWPFTPTTNFGVNTNATGTIMNFTVGLQASSTSNIFALNLGSSTPTSFANAPLIITGNTNTYVQSVISNRTSGNNASSLFATHADIGTDLTYYTEFGINNSGYSQSAFASQNQLDSFLTASDGALVLGTASTTNTLAGIRFITGGTASSSIRAVITQSGLFGIGTTSPWAQLSINAPAGTPSFSIGSSSASLFGINQFGAISVSSMAVVQATSTTITYDWTQHGPLTEYNIGASAITINVINATTTYWYGSTHKICLANPTSAAGAVTINFVEGISGYTQTTTANQEDCIGMMIIHATSTPLVTSTPTFKVIYIGAQTGIQ